VEHQKELSKFHSNTNLAAHSAALHALEEEEQRRDHRFLDGAKAVSRAGAHVVSRTARSVSRTLAHTHTHSAAPPPPARFSPRPHGESGDHNV
jgi:hypothetical protein